MQRRTQAAPLGNKLYRASVNLLGGTRISRQTFGSSFGADSSGSVQGNACDHYEVDLTGAKYGDCKCGYPKRDHVQNGAAGRINNMTKQIRRTIKSIRVDSSTNFRSKPPPPKSAQPSKTQTASSHNIVASPGRTYKGCKEYQLDMTGSGFGVCKCGYGRNDHSPKALEKAKTAGPVRHGPAMLYGETSEQTAISLPVTPERFQQTSHQHVVPQVASKTLNKAPSFTGGSQTQIQKNHTDRTLASSRSPNNQSNSQLDKYLKMKKAGLPQGAIEQAMIRDGVDPSLMSWDDELDENDIPPPPPQFNAPRAQTNNYSNNAGFAAPPPNFSAAPPPLNASRPSTNFGGAPSFSESPANFGASAPSFNSPPSFGAPSSFAPPPAPKNSIASFSPGFGGIPEFAMSGGGGYQQGFDADGSQNPLFSQQQQQKAPPQFPQEPKRRQNFFSKRISSMMSMRIAPRKSRGNKSRNTSKAPSNQSGFDPKASQQNGFFNADPNGFGQSSSNPNYMADGGFSRAPNGYSTNPQNAYSSNTLNNKYPTGNENNFPGNNGFASNNGPKQNGFSNTMAAPRSQPVERKPQPQKAAPKQAARKAPAHKGGGGGGGPAFLSDIAGAGGGPKAFGLKKTVTNDRSAPNLHLRG